MSINKIYKPRLQASKDQVAHHPAKTWLTDKFIVNSQAGWDPRNSLNSKDDPHMQHEKEHRKFVQGKQRKVLV